MTKIELRKIMIDNNIFMPEKRRNIMTEKTKSPLFYPQV